MYTPGGAYTIALCYYEHYVHCRGCLHHCFVLLGAVCTLQGVPTPLLVLLGAVCTLQGVPMPLLCATRSRVYTTWGAYTITLCYLEQCVHYSGCLHH